MTAFLLHLFLVEDICYCYYYSCLILHFLKIIYYLSAGPVICVKSEEYKNLRKEQSIIMIFSDILLYIVLRRVSGFIKSHHQSYIKYLQTECLHAIIRTPSHPTSCRSPSHSTIIFTAPNCKIEVSFIWVEVAEGTYGVHVGIFSADVLHMPDSRF
jgi:hypothetical protein